MSLTRYLPLPSDRMGILWNLLNIRDSIVVEYGPAGTTHFSMGLFGELGVDHENRLFTTHMSEEDVVMGDVSRLEKALVEIDRSYRPKVIFVVASSIAAVIGTDIKGICNYMQDKVQARLAAFGQGGFKGDYSIGCREVWKLLGDEFPIYKRKEENTYNLLGVSAGSYRAHSDVWEIQELLKEAFGLCRKAIFCLDTSIRELEEAGNAAMNLALRSEAVPCAQSMMDRGNIPYCTGMPYGYEGTLSWLQKVGKIIGKEPDLQVIKRLQRKSASASMNYMYAGMLKKDMPKASLAGEYHTITGLGSFLENAGISVENKICLHSLQGIDAPEEGVIHPSCEKEHMEIMKGLHKQLVLADDVSIRLCPRDNLCVRISMPILNGRQIANHLPIAGERGSDALLEALKQEME